MTLAKHLKHNPDLGLLLIRVGVGLVFLVHGWSKLSNLDMTVGFFAQIGLPVFFVWLVAALEFVLGLALILGLWVELSGYILAIIMLFAIILVKGSKGFAGGYEFDLVLLLSSLGLALLGGGKHTLMKHFGKSK